MAKGDSYIIKGLPADTLTSQVVDERRFKVEDSSAAANWDEFKQFYGTEISDSYEAIRVFSVPRNEAAIASGEYYVGATSRTGVPANDIYYYQITVGPAFFSIESILPLFDFTNLGDGSLEYRLDFFDSLSDGNEWTYTGGSNNVPIGRNINTTVLVNGEASSKTITTVSAGGDVTVTGDPDFNLVFASYYREVAGQRESTNSLGGSFFDDNRRLLLRPAGTYLVRAQTSGTITGTFDIRTQISATESTSRWGG